MLEEPGKMERSRTHWALKKHVLRPNPCLWSRRGRRRRRRRKRRKRWEMWSRHIYSKCAGDSVSLSKCVRLMQIQIINSGNRWYIML
jgi:hypothetical protein